MLFLWCRGAKPGNLGHSEEELNEEAKVTSQMIRVHQKVRQSSVHELAVPVLCNQEMWLNKYSKLHIKVLVEAEMRHNRVSFFSSAKGCSSFTQDWDSKPKTSYWSGFGTQSSTSFPP